MAMQRHRARCLIVLVATTFAILTGSLSMGEATDASNLTASGKKFQHPLGFSFQYPDGWQVQQTQDGMALVPPKAETAMYLILNEPVQGFSGADDPSFIQNTDTQIKALFPYLQRVGQVEVVKTTNGSGSLMTWEGTGPLGNTVRARMFVAFLKGNSVALAALGEKAQVEARDDLMRAVFATFGSGMGGGNPVVNPLAAQAPVNPLNMADPYVGTFKNENMTLELKASDGGYTGTVHFDGQEFPVVAQKADGSLSGTFQAQGQAFQLAATLKGSTLSLSTGGSTYTLEKQASANPLAVPTNPLAGQNQVAPLQGGKTYQDPLGFNFRYPQTWQVQKADEALQLIPPDAASNAQGSTEAYLMFAEPADGISRPDDPRFAEYLDNELRKLLPFLKRTGKTTPIPMGKRAGVLIQWDGKSPTGMQVHAYAFMTILNGHGCVLAAIGVKERVEARKLKLQSIFLTLGFTEPERDTGLVGSWRRTNTYVSGDFSAASDTYMTLQADGTAYWSSHMMAGGSSGTVDTGGSTPDRGRWRANAGKLSIQWEDGTHSQYGYYIEGTPGSRDMLLKLDDEKRQLWKETR